MMNGFTECHGVEALVFLIDKLDVLTVTHVRTIAWAYSNMCRHKNPNASIEVLKVLVNGLFKLLQHAVCLLSQCVSSLLFRTSKFVRMLVGLHLTSLMDQMSR